MNKLYEVFCRGVEEEWLAIYTSHGPLNTVWGDVVQDGYIDFCPAAEYSGAKTGYVFKTGVQGCGYYQDVGIVGMNRFWPWGDTPRCVEGVPYVAIAEAPLFRGRSKGVSYKWKQALPAPCGGKPRSSMLGRDWKWLSQVVFEVIRLCKRAGGDP